MYFEQIKATCTLVNYVLSLKYFSSVHRPTTVVLCDIDKADRAVCKKLSKSIILGGFSIYAESRHSSLE